MKTILKHFTTWLGTKTFGFKLYTKLLKWQE